MQRAEFSAPRTVMVTGGGGHLGGKAVEALAGAAWCESIICTTYGDEAPVFSEAARAKLTTVRADLTKPGGAWEDAIASAEAVIHFAAANPVPDATWDEAVRSFDMTENVALAALRHGLRRLVFCSSNHVVGGYKDEPRASEIGPGRLTTALAAPGTRWANGAKFNDSTAYAASKLLGERCVAAAAAASGGRLGAVSVRIGWALPGDNAPTNVNLSGSPNDTGVDTALTPEDARSLRWFRCMWLSNGDFARMVVASLTADPAGWPGTAVVVNAVSANAGMDWSLDEGRRWIGYEPQDDLFADPALFGRRAEVSMPRPSRT